MPTAASFHECGPGQSTVPIDKGFQRRKSVGPVDINDDKSGEGASCNSDVGVWPFAPPRLDLPNIGGRCFEAALGARMLAGVLTAIPPAGASPVLNGVKGKDAPAAKGIRQRPIEVGF